MLNFLRRKWAAILFLGLMATFVVALVLSSLPQAKIVTSRPDTTKGAATQTSHQPLPGAPATNISIRASEPLLAAGDEKTLWVVHPVLLDSAEGKKPGYELMARSSNSGLWTGVRDRRGNAYFTHYPRGLAVVSPPPALKIHATAYVFGDEGGAVQGFTIGEDRRLIDKLRPDHALLATTGAVDGAFALTAGTPDPSTTQPGDVLKLTMSVNTATYPAAVETAPAPEPATAAAPAAALINAYWFHDDNWTMLPPLGPVLAEGESANSVPSPGAHVALVQVPGRLVALWVHRASPDEMVARALAYRQKDAHWSAPVRSHLPAPVPANSRLLPVMLDRTLYVFWPALNVDGKGLELQGGWLVTHSTSGDLAMPAKNFLTSLSLQGAGKDLSPATDVALGPAENSLAVVVNDKENKLVSFLFSGRGERLSGPTPVELQMPQHDAQIAQNIAMLLLALLLTLSLWQWRQRPGPLKLSSGMAIAQPVTRGLAFLFDAAIPFVVICTVHGLWENGQWYTKLLAPLAESILKLDNLAAFPSLAVFLGAYLLHVTIGELFFRRSIGKALTGLQVLMIDGKPPTVAAILVRNLIRLPEMMVGIIFIYIFISPNRQRLGDLVARTIVISAQALKTPEDPDRPG